MTDFEPIADRPTANGLGRHLASYRHKKASLTGRHVEQLDIQLSGGCMSGPFEALFPNRLELTMRWNLFDPAR